MKYPSKITEMVGIINDKIKKNSVEYKIDLLRSTAFYVKRKQRQIEWIFGKSKIHPSTNNIQKEQKLKKKMTLRLKITKKNI